MLRLKHFAATNNPAGCRATAEMWEGLGYTDAGALVDAAQMRGTAAALYEKAGQPAKAAAEAEKAMDWLTKAVTGGYRNRAYLERSPAFAAVRGRADFRKLVERLPSLAPPPRPVGRFP